MKYRFLVLLFLSLLFSSACSVSETKKTPVKSQAEIVSLMVDMQLLEARLNFLRSKGSNVDSLSVKMYDSLFTAHNYTRKDLSQTLQDYSERPKELQEIYDSVAARIEKMKNRSK